ncbi:MAG: Uma2 family endonuclease [Cyanobacteria bacterium J06597_1]
MVQLLLEQITVAPGRSLLLQNVPWRQYESILQELGQHRSTRIAYDRGTIELVTPLPQHENSNRAIERFLAIITEELNLPLESYGSTTLNREDLQRGAEPDSCYYLRSQPSFQNGKLDLATGAPPDLVVEIDITNRDLDKPALYTQLGIPEFWRFDGVRLQILQLINGHYQDVTASPSFPGWVTETLLLDFLADCSETGTTTAVRQLRSHIQALMADT